MTSTEDRPDDYLTRAELAVLLRVTPRTVLTYQKKGLVPPPKRWGRKSLWSRQELLAFAQTSAAGAAK